MPTNTYKKAGRGSATVAAGEIASHQSKSSNSTVLHHYLDKTLRSPRLRLMLEQSGEDHTGEVTVARRA